jgi:hypothetical protein
VGSSTATELAHHLVNKVFAADTWETAERHPKQYHKLKDLILMESSGPWFFLRMSMRCCLAIDHEES